MVTGEKSRLTNYLTTKLTRKVPLFSSFHMQIIRYLVSYQIYLVPSYQWSKTVLPNPGRRTCPFSSTSWSRMQYLAQVSQPRGRHFYQKCHISNPEGTILNINVLFPIQGAGFWSNMSYLQTRGHNFNQKCHIANTCGMIFRFWPNSS